MIGTLFWVPKATDEQTIRQVSVRSSQEQSIRRPLVELAAALCLGSWLGGWLERLTPGLGHSGPSITALAEVAWLKPAALASILLVLVIFGRLLRPNSALAPTWLAVALVANAARVHGPPPSLHRLDDLKIESTSSVLERRGLTGIWRSSASPNLPASSPNKFTQSKTRPEKQRRVRAGLVTASSRFSNSSSQPPTVGQQTAIALRAPNACAWAGERVAWLPPQQAQCSAAAPALLDQPSADADFQSSDKQAANYRPEVLHYEVDPDQIVRLAPPRENLIAKAFHFDGRAWREHARVHMLRGLQQLPAGDCRDLANALLLGETANLSYGLRDLFTRTGTRHLLAISGLHVGLMAWFALGGLRKLFTTLQRRRIWKRSLTLCEPVEGQPTQSARGPLSKQPNNLFRGAAALLLLGLALAFYVPLTGSRSPVARAAWMLLLVESARLLVPLFQRNNPKGLPRRVDTWSLWGAALCFECLRNPLCAWDLSTQLSHLAVLGLGWLAPSLARTLRRPLSVRAGHSVALQARPIQALAKRLARGFITGIAAGAAATWITLPIIWSQFGEWSPWGLVATPLALPCLAWLLASGWILACLGASAIQDGYCVRAVAQSFQLANDVLVQLLETLDRMPGSPWVLPERPLWLLVSVCVGVALLWKRSQRNRDEQTQRDSPLVSPALTGNRVAVSIAVSIATSIVGMLTFVLLCPWQAHHPGANGLEVYALDVGHGSAFVLRTPHSGVWIYDAGTRDRWRMGNGALSQFLRRLEVRPQAVVLSHNHRDHCSGLHWLMSRMPPSEWYGARLTPEDSWSNSPLQDPNSSHWFDLEMGSARLNDQLQLVRGLKAPGNEGSRNLVARTSRGSVVLLGDAEEEGLRRVLDRGQLASPCALLVLPHHGSDGPHLGRLLDELSPAEVWISCSGVPPVAAELDRRGIPWLSTSLHGPLDWSESGLARPVQHKSQPTIP